MSEQQQEEITNNIDGSSAEQQVVAPLETLIATVDDTTTTTTSSTPVDTTTSSSTTTTTVDNNNNNNVEIQKNVTGVDQPQHQEQEKQEQPQAQQPEQQQQPTEPVQPTEPEQSTPQVQPTAEPVQPTEQQQPAPQVQPTPEPVQPVPQVQPTTEPVQPTQQVQPTTEPVQTTTTAEPIEEVVDKQRKTKCSFHTNDYYNSFCKDCQTPICPQCTLSHKQHNILPTIPFDDFTNKLAVFSTLNVEASDRAQDKAHLLELMAQLEDNNKSCKLLIQERFKEFQFLIKQREMNLEKEIQKEYDATKLELTKRLNLIDKDLSQVQTQWDKSKPYQQSTPTELYETNLFEVLEQYSLSDKKVRHIQTSDYNLLKPVDVPVKFVLDIDQLKKKSIVDELSGLGTISTVKQSTFRPIKLQHHQQEAQSPSILPYKDESSSNNADKSSSKKDRKSSKSDTLDNNNSPLSTGIGSPNYNSGSAAKYIYSIGGWNENGTDLGTCHKYIVESNEWKLLKSVSTDALPFVSSSCASDGKYIYVFGGNYEINTYRRFNINKQTWEKPEKMNRGGGGIAAQFDGKKHIYIFGGKVLDDSKPYHQIVQRIERYNVSTKQFSTVGSMSKHKYSCFTCFDGRYIYLVGGQVVNGRACKEIERFDTVEQKSAIYASLGGGGMVQGCALDPQGECIYYMTQTTFKRFTIATKFIQTLAFPPLTETSCRPTLVFDSKSKIFLFDQNDNFCFDLATSKWSKFNFNRKYSLCGQGCVVSNS
ncbi:hypothetical protein DFA_09932 [Cavenderia fasciculata]|uniref:B box-type domain-containing protein n=1 Tax=Cavenderia fasciculata TaxID=261658 RepID=F4Q8T9_CACFS|nr:uncharacterized protein DFA_09932 [Cavenderia fasciculata]EGG15108.1 hypothetical protein DFA_09932 [Cavenderia fasciculata]|eukprot:XP_004351828.1 hypothetical protein DFA_09932 [Cavenderia fasciculata]